MRGEDEENEVTFLSDVLSDDRMGRAGQEGKSRKESQRGHLLLVLLP